MDLFQGSYPPLTPFSALLYVKVVKLKLLSGAGPKLKITRVCPDVEVASPSHYCGVKNGVN